MSLTCHYTRVSGGGGRVSGFDSREWAKFQRFSQCILNRIVDDGPELCTRGLSKVIVEGNETCYSTMVILIGALIVSGMANVAYYALGISYLDDNTKARHVPVIVGVIVAVKIIGTLVGFFLGWGCLR